MDCSPFFSLQRYSSYVSSTETAVLKLITDRNLFSPAMPSAFIFSTLRRGGEIFCYSLYSLGKWIMMAAMLQRVKPKKKKRYRCQTSQSFNENFSTYSLYAAGRFQRLHVNRVQSVWNSRGRKGKRDWEKTARVKGFVLCVSGADAGVVLFI